MNELILVGGHRMYFKTNATDIDIAINEFYEACKKAGISMEFDAIFSYTLIDEHLNVIDEQF